MHTCAVTNLDKILNERIRGITKVEAFEKLQLNSNAH